MIVFWLAAALLALGAGGLIVARAARSATSPASEDPALAVHRRALAEIDALAERGLIAPGERRATRAEAGRRLLAAAERSPRAPSTALKSRWLTGAAAGGPLLALALYLAVGSPSAPDRPFAGRLARWLARPELDQPAELAAALSALAAGRPTDPEPPRRLAALDLSLGDADGAIHALRRANAIAPGRPDLLAPLGELLVLKAGGDVGPEARALFSRTLAGDPGSPTARYYLGRAEIAGGRLGAGRGMWRALLDDLPAGDPRRPLLAREIAVAERTGRLADAAPSGPPVRIFAAIRGMVDGLAARLRLHPDDPAGWARLVRAYGVLGEGESRAAALREARRLYAGRPDVLEALAAAQTPRSDAARP